MVCGELDVLDILYTAGADLNTSDIHGAFPIHYAAQMCSSTCEMGVDSRVGLTMLRRLIKYGAQVDVKDRISREPLMWAASSGSTDAILSIVNVGASVSAVDKDGLTALHCAASRGHHDCIEALIGLCGAEVDVLDNNGSSPLFYAVTLGHSQCTTLLITKFNANPNIQDIKGRSCCHCGAGKGQLETLKVLAKSGANLWLKNQRGDLPLHEAVHSGRKDLVRWLLNQKPDATDASNNDGRCPLHIAAINNHVEMCKILIDKGANVNSITRNSKGHLMTPLDAAIYRGNKGCAKYIQLHGGYSAAKLTSKNALQKAMSRALAESKAISDGAIEHESSKSASPKKRVREELLAGGGTTSGGESGGSPITVLQMQMGDEMAKDVSQGRVEIETQTEKPGNEDKETGITQEELHELAEKECRETQVTPPAAETKEVNTELSMQDPDNDISEAISPKVKSGQKREKTTKQRHKPEDSDRDSKAEDRSKYSEDKEAKSKRDQRKVKPIKTADSYEDSDRDSKAEDRSKYSEGKEVKSKRDQRKVKAIKSADSYEESDRDSKAESSSKQSEDREIKSKREQRQEKTIKSKDSYEESDREEKREKSMKSRDKYESSDATDADESVMRSRSDDEETKFKSDHKKGRLSKQTDKLKDSDREVSDIDEMDERLTDRKNEKSKRYDDLEDDDRDVVISRGDRIKDENIKRKDSIGKKKEKTVRYKDEQKGREKQHVQKEESVEISENSSLEDMKKTLDDLNSIIKSNGKRKFDPTKANVNGVSIDDDKYSDGKPEGETDDSRGSSYDTSQKRKSSVHGGYRQPNGLDSSRTTDAASALKDSGYSDAGEGSRLETPDGYLGAASSTDYDSSTPFDRQRQKKFAGRADPEDTSFEDPKEILKTITDEYDETLEDDYYQRVFSEAPVRPGGPYGLEEPRLFNSSRGIPLDVLDEDEGISNGKKTSKGYRNNIGRGGGMRMSLDGDGFEPVEQHNRDKSNNLYRSNSLMRCPPNLPEAPSYISRAPKPPNYSIGLDADKRIPNKKPSLISPDFSEGQDRFPPYDDGKFASQYGSFPGNGGGVESDIIHDEGRINHMLNCPPIHPNNDGPRPQTTGDVPRISVTQAVQNSLRKYQVERKIFEELLELKRMQIRAGRANESVLVKRLSDKYSKEIQSTMGLKTHDGPYTFKEFEKYLYSQLRNSQYGRPSSMPLPSSNGMSKDIRVIVQSSGRKSRPQSYNQLRSLQQASRMNAPPPHYLQKSEDELDRLTNALKRHGIECTSTLKHAYSAYANKTTTSSRRLFRGHSSHSAGSGSSQGISDDPACCTHSTHRCHHAAHAYTGLPCHTGNRGRKNYKKKGSILPKIDNGRLPARTSSGPGRLGRPPSNGYYPNQRHEETIHVSEKEFRPGVTPLTLELQHGNQKHAVCLPTDNLDKSKKYYVTFTINKSTNDLTNHGNEPSKNNPNQVNSNTNINGYDKTTINGNDGRNDKNLNREATFVSEKEKELSQNPLMIFNRMNVHKDTSKATLRDEKDEVLPDPTVLKNPLKIFDRVRVENPPYKPDEKSPRREEVEARN